MQVEKLMCSICLDSHYPNCPDPIYVKCGKMKNSDGIKVTLVDNRPVQALICGAHTYHPDCIKDWFNELRKDKKPLTCPQCQKICLIEVYPQDLLENPEPLVIEHFRATDEILLSLAPISVYITYKILHLIKSPSFKEKIQTTVYKIRKCFQERSCV